MTKAAGILFITDDGQALLLKRGDGSDYPGAWCFPGGTTEEGETPEETAERETIEELGFLPEGKRILLTRQISAEGVDYTTFIQRVKKPFVPKLNGEHDAFMWGDPEKILGEILPAPLPPGPSDGWGSITSAFRSDDTGFEESDHPRDEDGKFTSGGGGSGGKGEKGTSRDSLSKAQTVNGKRVNAAGLPLPPHIEKLKLPPAWKDVQYSEDPDASLLAVGRDAKGRVQSVYSAKFVASQAEAKFSRISELMTKFDSIVEQNDNARKSDNPKAVEAADCLNLIMKMGVRPGSETDTGAKVKAYGATTLEGKHVVQTEDGVFLKFTGKKGVDLSLRVDDKELANNLVDRANKAGADGQLFSVSDKQLLDHTHSMDGGSFKTKDLRTRLGTQTALDAVNSMPKPKDEKEYKKAVMEVAGQVSKKLGNTPVIALQSYISPVVFAAWKIGE